MYKLVILLSSCISTHFFQPTPEPKKPKNKKKNKIPIEDVEEVVEEVVPEAPAPELVEAPAVVEEEEVVEKVEVVELPSPPQAAPEPVAKSTPTKGKGKKQKSEATAAPQVVLPGTPKDLLTAIKKTSFNDEDAQAIINVLLTKQSGDAMNTSEEWIEQGKPSETKQLKQELTEAFKALEEERNHKIAFEKQLTTMKKDLNEKLAGVKKAAGAEHQRIMGELVAQHTHQMNQTNARLAEMHNNEMAMRSRLDEVQMEKIHTVTQFQAQVDNLAHQLQVRPKADFGETKKSTSFNSRWRKMCPPPPSTTPPFSQSLNSCVLFGEKQESNAEF